jgi:hypothetical protein
MTDMSKDKSQSMGEIVDQLQSVRDTLNASARSAATAGTTTRELGARIVLLGVRDKAAALLDLKDRIDHLAAHIVTGVQFADEAIARAHTIRTGQKPGTAVPEKG